jgi:PTH1 family peptidyl-tRNA hydrolase
MAGVAAEEPAGDRAGDGPWLVVGLGNPGPRYAGNRHNVGAMVVGQLASDLGARLSAHRSRAQVAEARLPPAGGRPGARLVLAVPTAYMNESGGQVSSVVRFFKTDPERLLVVHDELDLPFADLMLKRGGGEGGHNGLRSVSQSLGTRDYGRLRIGVGRPPGRIDPADFVLRDFSAPERKELPFVISDAVDAVVLVVQEGWERAQERVNGERRSRQVR